MQAKWLNSLSNFTKQNSPTILSGIAVGGVVATAILAARAARKVEWAYDERMTNKPRPRTKADWIKETWTFYIPAGLSGAATIACIIGANQIGARRNAALVAAYSLMDNAFREYKDHVIEEIGEVKNRKIREKIAEDRIKDNPPEEGKIIVTGGGEQLCYEKYSGRYFRSDIEKIRRAENDFNKSILDGNLYGSLNDFYDYLGLPNLHPLGEDVGWNIRCKLDLVFSSHLRESDGTACLVVDYREYPTLYFDKDL